MIKAVIFDMDGLMVDTEFLHSEAHAAVIKKYGKRPKKLSSGVVHIVGKSILENSEIIRQQYGIKEKAEVLEIEKHKAYLALLKNKKVPPKIGLKNLIKLLKKNNIKLAIGSAGIRAGILLIIENLNVQDHFPVVISLDDVNKPKPSPDIFLEAAKRLQVDPEYCLVLEDSQVGVEAAKNAGMKSIAVPSKYTIHQDFSKATLIMDSLKSIKWSTILDI